ncbi:MAG: hypothetical protein KC448_15010 [Yoonia sp.]|nr:hypothetical protein [Yoonia sp.]
MRLDSDVASRVINTFTSEGILVLCIHDSFVVDYRFGQMLRQVMAEASEAVVGRPINVTSDFLGLDEVERNTPEQVDGYLALRHLEPCPEYIGRLHFHG